MLAMTLFVIPLLRCRAACTTVYLYVPLIGAAIWVAAIANVRPKYVVPLFAFRGCPIRTAKCANTGRRHSPPRTNSGVCGGLLRYAKNTADESIYLRRHTDRACRNTD